MTIDKENLIALLVKKTKLSEQQVREQLEQLKDRLGNVVETGAAFAIDGFGEFSEREGTLHFEPGEQLKTEINQKYAGMCPIEMMEAFRDTGAGVPVEEAPSEAIKKDQPEESKTVSAASIGDEKLERPTEQPPDQPEKGEEKQGEKENATPVNSDKSYPPSHGKRKSGTRQRSKRRDPLGIIVLVSVIAIVILLGGWLLYNHGIFNDFNIGLNNGGSTAAMPADTTEQNTTSDVSTNNAGRENAASTPYGLMGTVNVRAENAYTIVIHSFHLESTIQPMADSLHKQGFRTLLFQQGVGNAAQWSLALGQFKTRESAQKAAQKLAAPYKEHHYIKQLNE